MPSNDSPAFDVLSAAENDLWEWAVERAGVENAATYIRDAAVQAERARQTERGESPAPEAEREPDELADAQRLLAIVMEQRAELTAELDALKQSRDTDLARARVEGITEALGIVESEPTRTFRETTGTELVLRHTIVKRIKALLPAPEPTEVVLSDGSVVGWNEWETPQPHRTIDIVTNKGRAGCESRRCFKSLEDMRAFPLPYADWQLIDKAFAATPTEDTTDGR